MMGDSPVYNVVAEITFEGNPPREHLECALEQVVQRHESLRTTFAVVDGEPVQVVHATQPLTIAFDDLRAVPPSQRAEVYTRITTELSDVVFDLARGPLLRARFVWTDPDSSVLMLVMHHIVTDGWSSRLLEEEIRLVCDALRQQTTCALPDLPVQYGDFAVWQRELVAATYKDRLAWWSRTLAGAPAALSFPLDRARPPVTSFRGTTLTFRLPTRLSAALAELCQRAGATGFMATLAAFKFLLAQHCDATDIVVGTPVAGRNHPDLERVIGFFVNTIVIRSNLSGPLTFLSLLECVRQVAMDAYAHQDLPFERLVAELAPDRRVAVTPLFQAMFTYDPADPDEPETEQNIRSDAMEIDAASSGTSKFDVTLALTESRNGLDGVLEFNADVFTGETMMSWLRHYHALLEYAVAHPESPLTSAALMTEGETEQVVKRWNRTRTDYPRHSTIHAIFDDVAARLPYAPAVVDRDRVVSYGELLTRTNLLAGALRARGVRRGILVGICADRSLEFVAGTLAILKAGGAYVPLDPAYPAERLRMMVEDTGLSIVLATAEHAGTLRGFPVSIVQLESPGTMPDSSHDTHGWGEEVGPEDLAYVIYTSGSTGRPKGVAVPHRAVLRLVCQTDYITLGPGDAVAHASNTSFDAATFEIWGALLTGARLVVVQRDLLLTPSDLVLFLRSERITTLFITTPLFHEIAAGDPESFGSLRDLLFGGDVVDPGLVREVIRSASPPARLLHVYGPTETTTFATWHLVRDVPDGAITVPIGHPIANTEAYILDADQRPVAIGVGGELYIGGDGVARGYLGRPDATAASFVAHPFDPDPAARLYRTGDLARWRPDGHIEFLGRIDRQVKVRGFRVEPGEVEVTLAQCDGVRQVAVVPHGNGAGRYLVAYVSALPTADLSTAALRLHARERLPDYMVPSHFVMMPELPLTANGKIDRDALLPPEAAPVDHPSTFVPPQSEAERTVAGVWREVLNVDQLGVDDNFFDLGGHSLLLIKVLGRLRQLVQVELSVLDLFRFPTIAALGSEMDSRVAAASQNGGDSPAPEVLASLAIVERAARLRRALSRRHPDEREGLEADS
jgi:amino acid adenylation domain-containing protein